MRPERSRETGRAARVARGRLLVKADSAWLGGYPTGTVVDGGLAWCVPASPGRPLRAMTLDRASLHRATRALTELELRFGDVLGDVVDEPRAWMAGARAALAVLKPLVHGPTPRPPTPETLLASGVVRPGLVAAIRGAPAPLRFALDAAAWMTLAEPPRLARIVAFALSQDRLAATLRAVLKPADADRAMLHLSLVAEAEGGKRVESLVRLLSNRTLYDSPTTGLDYARALSREPRGKRAPKPEPTVGPALAAWTAVLSAAEPRARRGTLALLDVLELAPAAHEWTAWWSRLSRAERLTQGEPDAEVDARVAGKATRLADAAPRLLHGETLTWLLTRTLAWDEATHREAMRALRELPAYAEGVPVRLAFLEHWNDRTDDAKEPPAGKGGGKGKMAAMLGVFAKYLVRTRAHAARALAPWARLLDCKRRGAWSGAPDESLLEDVPPARWPVFFDALALSAGDEALDPARIALALLAVVPLVADAGHALALAKAMAPDGNWGRNADRVKVAFELCATSPRRSARRFWPSRSRTTGTCCSRCRPCAGAGATIWRAPACSRIPRAWSRTGATSRCSRWSAGPGSWTRCAWNARTRPGLPSTPRGPPRACAASPRPTCTPTASRGACWATRSGPPPSCDGSSRTSSCSRGARTASVTACAVASTTCGRGWPRRDRCRRRCARTSSRRWNARPGAPGSRASPPPSTRSCARACPRSWGSTARRSGSSRRARSSSSLPSTPSTRR